MIRSFPAVISVLLIFLSCGKLPPAVGKSRDVIVVSVIVDSQLVGGGLQVIHRFPQPEPVFNFIYAPDTALKRFRTFRTIFLYGSLRDVNINRLLNDDARNAIARDNVALFKKYDLWARGQLVLILAVAEPPMLWDAFDEYRSLIGRILEDNYENCIRQEYRQVPLDEDLNGRLRRFGVAIDLHPGWLIDSTFSGDGFIFVHAHYPDRSIFFYREPGAKALSESLALRKRNELTRRFYRGDQVMNASTALTGAELDGRHALRLQGVWQNDSLIAGGPFLTYIFNAGDTFCMVDGILFLPGERKSEHLVKLDIALKSCRIVPADTAVTGK